MVNNVIGVVNYLIAARPSLLNFVIADKSSSSLLRLSLIVFVPVLLGFSLALVWTRGISLVPVLPALAAFLLMVTALCLESAWARTLTVASRRAFFIAFGCVLGVWLAVMLYGTYVWNLAMPLTVSAVIISSFPPGVIRPLRLPSLLRGQLAHIRHPGGLALVSWTSDSLWQWS